MSPQGRPEDDRRGLQARRGVAGPGPAGRKISRKMYFGRHEFRQRVGTPLPRTTFGQLTSLMKCFQSGLQNEFRQNGADQIRESEHTRIKTEAPGNYLT